MKKILIIGATSKIALECAKIWAKQSPCKFYLVVRNIKKGQDVANDLRVRHPDSVYVAIESNFIEPNLIEATLDNIFLDNHIDVCLIAQGALLSQYECQKSLSTLMKSIEVNGASPVLFAEGVAKRMLQEPNQQGKIAIIGSVAGDRGRKSNYAYGAAKSLVDSYVKGMQHRFAHEGPKVILIKPGPTATPMTTELAIRGAKLASATLVASDIVEAISKNKSILYTPFKWTLIMLIIRNIPFVVFKKLDI
jgi:decaprenylphospho-beta-D-erythro-pentofuranosid-2-ulose 2-reductase